MAEWKIIFHCLKVYLLLRELSRGRHFLPGASNREVAEHLYLTEETVKNHMSTILSKLGVRDRTQAVLRAKELGLV